MKTRYVLLLGLLLLGLCVPVLATRAAGRPPARPPADGGPRSPELYAFARHLQVGPPVRYEHLTIFPVMASGVRVPEVTMTLDLAGAKGLMEVAELKDSEVNRLTLRSSA